MRGYYVTPFWSVARLTLSLKVTDNCAAIYLSAPNNLWYHDSFADILHPVDLMLTCLIAYPHTMHLPYVVPVSPLGVVITSNLLQLEDTQRYQERRLVDRNSPVVINENEVV
jgi:hypothetical protein